MVKNVDCGRTWKKINRVAQAEVPASILVSTPPYIPHSGVPRMQVNFPLYLEPKAAKDSPSKAWG